jgi:hypothetical protein
MFKASLRTAGANDSSGASTPLAGARSPPTDNGTSTPADTTNATPLARLAHSLAAHPLALEEGATLNCISVSQVVVKHGRLTISPALSVALNGFSRAPAPGYGSGKLSPLPPRLRISIADLASAQTTPSDPPSFSRANPPPHWPETLALLSRPATSTVQLLRGGWRDVPPAARWWEHALGGEVEERRRANMERLHGLRSGMGGAVECYSSSS